MTEHKFTNALSKESSPYLLQHAHNPVDWMPWSDAAFEKAKREDKPIFLSIGYATCHWCHVMEHESFENEKIAEYMNAHYVCIKVDREERPDVDAVYMTVTQGLTGSGGWPMSVWMTPDRKPFMAGTYFPPDDRMGRAGFRSVLERISEAWTERRDDLDKQAEEITSWLQNHAVPKGKAELTPKVFENAVDSLKGSFDERYGGFGPAPKFPTSHRIQMLLRRDDKQALEQSEQTLRAMSHGGIYDHIGGGFHRYATDREWLTPHFEKMLYDQALIMDAYLDAHLVTGKQEYADVVHDIAAYVLRDLRDDSGAFHSAEDADSEGEEGKFYVWTMDELRSALGDEAELAAYVWGATGAGNYFDESTHERTGANILHLPRSVSQSAKDRDVDEAELRKKMAAWRETLFELRADRERPLLDDKVLTDWNGLMIGAMARAGAVLNKPAYLKAAQEAAGFILETMRKDGRLLHRFRKGQAASTSSGQAGINAYAEDYAYVLNGLFELYEADYDSRWLRAADELAADLVRLFLSKEEGVLHTQGSDTKDAMIAPNRNTFDGATPSANSAGALALVRLGKLLQKDEYVGAAETILTSLSLSITEQTLAHCYGLLALEWLLLPTREVVIAGDADNSETKAMLSELKSRFLPRTVIVLNEPDSKIAEIIPFVEAQGAVEGKPAAYVCENYACQAPVTSTAELIKLLDD